MVTSVPGQKRHNSSGSISPLSYADDAVGVYRDASSAQSHLFDPENVVADGVKVIVSSTTGMLPSSYGMGAPLAWFYSDQTSVGVGTLCLRHEVFRALQNPVTDQLFDRLNHWAELSKADWEMEDADPMTERAISGARRLLQILSPGILAGYLHHGIHPNVELLASRDGGAGIILSTRRRELEFSIEPDGDIGLLIVNLDQADPSHRYVERDQIDFSDVIHELGTFLA